ncbi:Uncharacterized protein PBTT_09082 [Plasmodiophora brassicae]
MHPFRTAALDTPSPHDSQWPLLGSVFADPGADPPVVPVAVRAVTQPAENDADLVDGHWIPFDNSRLAMTRIRSPSAPAPPAKSITQRKVVPLHKDMQGYAKR